MAGPDLVGRVDPLQLEVGRHLDVRHDDVRLELLRDLDQRRRVGGYPGHLDAVGRVQEGPNSRPDAVLTDIRMPPTNTTEGIQAARRIRAEHPDIGVVVLSQYAEESYAYELLKEGAGGLAYLLKERVADVDELVRALTEVTRGG